MNITDLPDDILFIIISMLNLHDFSGFYVQCKRLNSVWNSFKCKRLSGYLADLTPVDINRAEEIGRLSRDKLHEYIFLSRDNQLIEKWTKTHKISLSKALSIRLIRMNSTEANKAIKTGYISISWHLILIFSVFFRNYDMLSYSFCKLGKTEIVLNGDLENYLAITCAIPDEEYEGLKRIFCGYSRKEFYDFLRIFTVTKWQDMNNDEFIKIVNDLLSPKKGTIYPDISSILYLASISGSVDRILHSLHNLTKLHRKSVIDVMKQAAYNIIIYRNQKKYNIISGILGFAGYTDANEIYSTYITTLRNFSGFSGEEVEIIRGIAGNNRDMRRKIFRALNPEELLRIFPDLPDDPVEHTFALKYNNKYAFAYYCKNDPAKLADETGDIHLEYIDIFRNFHTHTFSDAYLKILINFCGSDRLNPQYIFTAMLSAVTNKIFPDFDHITDQNIAEKCYNLIENMAKCGIIPTFSDEKRYPKSANILDLLQFIDIFRLNPRIVRNIYRKNIPKRIEKNFLIKYEKLCNYCYEIDHNKN